MSDSKFLLLLGVSGVGKTTIMLLLRGWDSKFVYISPYITRQLRPGEQDKIPVSNTVMDEMEIRGELLTINTLFGIRYATPINPIRNALVKGDYPLLDWPVNKMSIMQATFPNQLYVVYIEPPSVEALKQRLAKDSRDVDGSRLQSAILELEQFHAGQFDGLYDLHVVTRDGTEAEVAWLIYSSYLASLGK